MKKTIEERMKKGHWVDCKIEDFEVGDIVDTQPHDGSDHPTEVLEIDDTKSSRVAHVSRTDFWSHTNWNSPETFRKWVEGKTCVCGACGSELALPEDDTYLCEDSDGDERLMILRGDTWYHCEDGSLSDSGFEGEYNPYTPIKRIVLEDV